MRHEGLVGADHPGIGGGIGVGVRLDGVARGDGDRSNGYGSWIELELSAIDRVWAVCARIVNEEGFEVSVINDYRPRSHVVWLPACNAAFISATHEDVCVSVYIDIPIDGHVLHDYGSKVSVFPTAGTVDLLFCRAIAHSHSTARNVVLHINIYFDRITVEVYHTVGPRYCIGIWGGDVGIQDEHWIRFCCIIPRGKVGIDILRLCHLHRDGVVLTVGESNVLFLEIKDT